MAIINFNANEVEPSKAFDPIPAGKYIAVISESVMTAIYFPAGIGSNALLGSTSLALKLMIALVVILS